LEDISSSAGLIENSETPVQLNRRTGYHGVPSRELVDFCKSAFRVSYAVFLCVVIRWPALNLDLYIERVVPSPHGRS
jgi:hypothetical protein